MFSPMVDHGADQEEGIQAKRNSGLGAEKFREGKACR